jgi:hypothetical protein
VRVPLFFRLLAWLVGAGAGAVALLGSLYLLLLLIVANRGVTRITNGSANQVCPHYSSEWRAGYRCDTRAQRRAIGARL